MEVVPASFHIRKTASCLFLYLSPEKNIKKYVYYSSEPLAKSSNPIYSYNKLDKVLDIRNGNIQTKQMRYDQGRQIANVKNLVKGVEAFFVLAQIQRNSTSVAGIDGKALFENILGSSLGVMEGNSFTAIDRTAFGETLERECVQFLHRQTGDRRLSYTFLFRNYQANTGKWQTSAPLGYPDDWNYLAYVNNWTFYAVDPDGLSTIEYDNRRAWDEPCKRVHSTEILYYHNVTTQYGTLVCTVTQTNYDLVQWFAYDIYECRSNPEWIESITC